MYIKQLAEPALNKSTLSRAPEGRRGELYFFTSVSRLSIQHKGGSQELGSEQRERKTVSRKSRNDR